MADKKDLEKPDQSADPELDQLLDSALEDLTKGVEKKDSKKEIQENVGGDEPKVQEWTDEYIKQAAQQFESNMAKIIGAATKQDSGAVSTSTIESNLQKMAEAAAQVIKDPKAIQPSQQSNDFSATITQTLQNLSLGAESLNNPFFEQEFEQMFANNANDNAFLPFMQGMMQSLLSKEVLYPSLRDILDKYPGWLEENESKIEKSDFDRYKMQKDLMEQVCEELLKEQDTDSDDVKRERFDKVLGLMHKMHDLGQPPSDIVGDFGPQIQFDQQGRPIIPEGIDINNLETLCSIM